MKSALPKVLHEIAGRPLLWHAITAAESIGPDRLITVIGSGREAVGAYLTREHPAVQQAVQAEQLGTGHAVICAFADAAPPTGTVRGIC